jgi:hypothetical protein
MRSPHWRPVLALLLASMLAGCTALDPKTEYACAGKGYVHRYRDGKEIDATAGDPIRFSLATFRFQNGFDISAVSTLVEVQNPAIVLDKSRSNDAERLYAYDVTDAQTHQRTLTTLVLNPVSGDFRLFHHRWIPPAQWQDSDQYFYSGNCLKSTS